MLLWKGGKYEIEDSLDIKGVPIYVGQIGNITNGIVIGASVDGRIGNLHKYGSYVDGMSLINYKIIDFTTGKFKEVRTNLNLPKKEVWDFESYDFDSDGAQELIIGVINEKRVDVEIYKFTSGMYELVTTFKTASKFSESLGFILADLNGDKQKEILTFDGTWIRYEYGKYRASNILTDLRAKFYYGPLNIFSLDYDHDGKDEVLIMVANLDTFVVNHENTGDYEAYLLDFQLE